MHWADEKHILNIFHFKPPHIYIISGFLTRQLIKNAHVKWQRPVNKGFFNLKWLILLLTEDLCWDFNCCCCCWSRDQILLLCSGGFSAPVSVSTWVLQGYKSPDLWALTLRSLISIIFVSNNTNFLQQLPWPCHIMALIVVGSLPLFIPSISIMVAICGKAPFSIMFTYFVWLPVLKYSFLFCIAVFVCILLCCTEQTVCSVHIYNLIGPGSILHCHDTKTTSQLLN